MKKTSIFLLCGLVILFLTAAFIFPTISMLGTFTAGYTDEKSSHAEAIYSSSTPLQISFHPISDPLEQTTDSLSFAGGKELPTIVQDAIVMVPDKQIHTDTFAYDIAIYALTCLCYLALVVLLIMFIVNISKSRIFEKSNISILSAFGWILLFMAVLDCGSGLLQEMNVEASGLAKPGYELSANWQVPWTSCLLGILSLLLAQVWSLGLKLQREQELTI